MDDLASALKVLGHGERLRIVALLSHGELTVSELVDIMSLSQPRVTQYVKSLEEAGIVERLKEGSWVFSRLNRRHPQLAPVINAVLNSLPSDDTALIADLRRLEDVRARRARSADAFFADVANDRGQLGDEYLPQADIEARIKTIIGSTPVKSIVDLGTGTGRMLQLFAGQVERGRGIDNNTDMLKVARHKLSSDNRTNITLRMGDLRATPFESSQADLVTLHQVLHYLEAPETAIAEAARLLVPGGRLLIVDFAPHEIERFRDRYAHRRLGLREESVSAWLAQYDLRITQSETVPTDDDKPDVRIWLAEKDLHQEKAI